jgi:hypothetical protein
LRERREHDLRDTRGGAERKDLSFRIAPQQRVIRLARNESLDVRQRSRRFDLRGRPFGEPDVAHLAAADRARERLHRFGEWRTPVVSVALIQVDHVDAQSLQRCVELLLDLFAREPAVDRAHREEHFRREHVGRAGSFREHFTE